MKHFPKDIPRKWYSAFQNNNSINQQHIKKTHSVFLPVEQSHFVIKILVLSKNPLTH